VSEPALGASSVHHVIAARPLDVYFVNPSPVFLLDKAGDCSHCWHEDYSCFA
jgi:hypothetical protein